MANKSLGVRSGKRRAERSMTRSAKLKMALTQAKDTQKKQQEDPKVIGAQTVLDRLGVRSPPAFPP